jgi:Protein of unknown function (DUF559)
MKNSKHEEFFNLSAEQLYDLYHNQQLNMVDIAKLYDFASGQPIKRRFNKLNIKIRDKGDSLSISNKKKNSHLTKEILIDLYIDKKLSMGEIKKLYGLKSNAKIRRLLKEFGIEIRTSAEASSLRCKKEDDELIIPKEDLINDLQNLSLYKISKKYNVHKGRVLKWIEKFEIEHDPFPFKYLKEELLLKENQDLSPKQLALKYNVTIRDIKRHKEDFVVEIYSVKEIKEKIIEYGYDITSRGFPKKLKYDDKNLYNSILYHSKNHILYTDKITEKLYRILNDFEETKTINCKYCSDILPFCSIITGYGGEHGICKKCVTRHNAFGISPLSQHMFWKIYERIEKKDNCKFGELDSGEFTLLVDKDFIENNQHLKLNKKFYKLDFVYENKVIEFDGEDFHTDEEKEIAKDEYLRYKGFDILHINSKEYYNNQNEVIEKCLTFLNQ